MSDFSKIDFSKCKLPAYENFRIVVRHDFRWLEILVGDAALQCVATCDKSDRMHRWRVRNLDASVRAFVEHLLECTKLVDAFIESELKRLADEALPPWRACSKEEASAHPERCEIFIGQWFPCNGKNIPDYRHRNGDSFRTRAPKAEPRHVSVVTVEVDGVRKFTLRPGTWAMISASIGGQWMLNATGTDDSVIIGDRLIGELSYCGGTGESEQG